MSFTMGSQNAASVSLQINREAKSLTSADDALLILGKWVEESSRLRVFCAFGRLGADFDCRIVRCGDKRVVLRLDESTAEIEVGLEDCVFEYAEPTRKPSKVPIGDNRRYLSCLMARSPTEGWIVTFFEVGE